jgi:hypothetical protein
MALQETLSENVLGDGTRALGGQEAETQHITERSKFVAIADIATLSGSLLLLLHCSIHEMGTR